MGCLRNLGLAIADLQEVSMNLRQAAGHNFVESVETKNRTPSSVLSVTNPSHHKHFFFYAHGPMGLSQAYDREKKLGFAMSCMLAKAGHGPRNRR